MRRPRPSNLPACSAASLSAVCLLAIVASAAVAVAPAAGAVEVLDRKKLAKQVGVTVTAAYPDLPVTKVVCTPKKVKRKAGATATCGVVAGDLRARDARHASPTRRAT